MSVPISATMARAARSPMPGMLRSRRTASRKGSRPRSFEAVLRTRVDLLERLRQRVVLAQVQTEQEAMAVADAPAQRRAQPRRLGLDPGVDQGEQPVGVGLAGDQRLEDGPPAR